jgi:hypothetical protein
MSTFSRPQGCDGSEGNRSSCGDGEDHPSHLMCMVCSKLLANPRLLKCFHTCVVLVNMEIFVIPSLLKPLTVKSFSSGFAASALMGWQRVVLVLLSTAQNATDRRFYQAQALVPWHQTLRSNQNSTTSLPRSWLG